MYDFDMARALEECARVVQLSRVRVSSLTLCQLCLLALSYCGLMPAAGRFLHCPLAALSEGACWWLSQQSASAFERMANTRKADGAYLLVALLLSDSLVWLAGRYRADSGEIFEALLFAIDQEAAVMASVVRTLLSNARRAVAMRGLRLFIDGEIEAKHLSHRATVEELFFVKQISQSLTLEEQELVVRAWVFEEKQAELAKELGYAVGSLRVILCRIRLKILEFAA